MTDRDTMIVAMTAYAEARGEGPAGIRAQIHSVINRHNAGRWYSGKTLSGTCFLPYAYSAMNTKDPNRVAAAEVPLDDEIFATCLSEAMSAIAGQTQDPTGGATHYYAAGSTEPNWVTGKDDSGKQVAPPATFTCQIGRHLFFKDVK